MDLILFVVIFIVVLAVTQSLFMLLRRPVQPRGRQAAKGDQGPVGGSRGVQAAWTS